MDNARKALGKARKELLSLPNVVGVGVGSKITRQKDTGEPSVVVLVKEKVPLGKLSRGSVVPSRVYGADTDVIEVGKIKMLDERTKRVRPIRPGVSIGHYQVSAGTLGAVVRDQSSGRPLLLSNCHVLANGSNGKDGRAVKGDPVLQPGSYDGGGVPGDVVGYLERFVPLGRTMERSDCPLAAAAMRVVNATMGAARSSYRWRLDRLNSRENVVDCAVARPVSNEMVEESIMGLGQIRGTAEARMNQTVIKSGRTSGITRGRVTSLDVTIKVEMHDQEVLFSDQVLCDMVSQSGDSGSLVVNQKYEAVGLLFAGSETVTVFNRIKNVLSALKVRF